IAVMIAALLIPLSAFADSTGEKNPTATSPATGSFVNPTRAFACDNTNVATATGNNDKQTYSMYGLSIPPTAIITGIQVRVRATDGTKNNRKLQVALSSNNGGAFTASLHTRNF